ncbi:MAG: ABC transporter permease [Chloroflexia bacterium]
MRANPVIVKELRGRMRGWGAAVALTLYLVVVSGVSLLFYSLFRSNSGGVGPDSPQVGKYLFMVIILFQTLSVFLLTPPLTTGAITSEKERKTYDVLVITLLSPRSIIFGKLGAALAFVALLIVALAPLESLTFMFGGVSPEEIILSQVVMLAAAVLFASIGIFWSSLVRSTVASSVLTYGTMIAQLVLIPVLYLLMTTLLGFYSSSNGGPSFASTEFFTYMTGIVLSSHPLIAMALSETLLLNGDSLFIYTSTTISSGHTILVVSPWLLFCVESLLVSALLVLLAIRAVQPVRIRRAARPARVGAEDQPSLARAPEQASLQGSTPGGQVPQAGSPAPQTPGPAPAPAQGDHLPPPRAPASPGPPAPGMGP